jgi:predicted DNA-binding transcriptional regulator
MTDRRVKQVVIRHREDTWSEVVTAGEVMMIQHLHHDHDMSIRQINRKLGMTDRMVRACLEGTQ